MEQLPTKYNPIEIEKKWYKYWMEQGYFHSEPDSRDSYCIVIPPPNVTGVLHMGHMLNNTIQDVLVRRARMRGKNACWVPGTDHASIATEAKVVDKLKKEGIEKASLSREEFLKHAWEWKEKHGGIILEQLKKLGASCDWQRTKFTMDAPLSEAVIDTFIHLYKKGWIYRGVRMVNWDPAGKTAVSDEEVIHKEVNSKLYYIKYSISGGEGHVIIATTRPETIMADTAICINPNDERYTHLHGKRVFIPLINKEIPIILDDYVSMEFGTGCLKVTPAHDINDYELGLKHNLPVIDILNDEGKLNEKAQILIGEDRFIARKKIAKLLEESGNLEKIEDYKSPVGFSERTDAVIEPRLSLQWFLKMEELAKPALKDVVDGSVKLVPDKFKATYRHWMENVRDWCISRQLWWGQQIPAWYLPDGSFFEVGKTADDALKNALASGKDCSGITAKQLKQDEDVVDTWFSSWLWPMSVFDTSIFADPSSKGNADINYYYPTNDLVTAPEILFFWVARMIMAGHEFRGEKPFRNVYLTGIVRDKQGRKMSKSLGNSPDPLDLIDKYSADGVRMGMLLCSAAGNDILFDESQVEQGRNFCNKIWNAFRLVQGWQVDEKATSPDYAVKAIEWFDASLNKAIAEINDDFDKYRISEALMKLYKLFWDDFCAWYLELIKPGFEKPIDTETYQKTLAFFDTLLRLLHPFMPFISEEIWHYLEERKQNDSIMVCLQPKPVILSDEDYEKREKLLDGFVMTQKLITEIRNYRVAKKISPKESLIFFLEQMSTSDKILDNFLDYFNGRYNPENNCIIKKISNADIKFLQQNDISLAFNVGLSSFYNELGNRYSTEEYEKLKSDLKYLTGFKESVLKKLGNDNFVSRASEEIVEAERKKLADAEAKIKALQEQIARLE